MPRDVTVIFESGAPEIYRGVPDDVKPEDVIRRARQENPDRAVKMLDGGKGADIRRGFIDRASGMGTDDLSIARTKNDDFGGYLRDQASQPKPGETPDETFKRQYGGLPMPERPGAVEGVARAGLQGGTVGAGDEIVASGKALLDTILRGARDRAGLTKATCHQLRHTCLTRLREAGMELEAVQAQAGHASIESTRIYLHLTNDWLAAEYRRATERIDADAAAELRSMQEINQ